MSYKGTICKAVTCKNPGPSFILSKWLGGDRHLVNQLGKNQFSPGNIIFLFYGIGLRQSKKYRWQKQYGKWFVIVMSVIQVAFLFVFWLCIYTGSKTTVRLMCYQGISGNIFNEQFFLYLPNILLPWKKKKRERKWKQEQALCHDRISSFLNITLNPVKSRLIGTQSCRS